MTVTEPDPPTTTQHVHDRLLELVPMATKVLAEAMVDERASLATRRSAARSVLTFVRDYSKRLDAERGAK